MELTLKDNWSAAQAMYKAWWKRENSERPLLLIQAPRHEPAYETEQPPAPLTPEARWMDADFRVLDWERWAVQTYFAGDSFPYFDPQIGPGSLALFLGARPGFDWGTVWYHKCFDDLATAPLPTYDEANPLWQQQLDLIRAGGRLHGKALTSFPDIIEGVDILSSLAGATETLLGLMDCPERVHELVTRIDELYFVYYEKMRELVVDDDGGTCFSAFQVWGPGRTAKVQCDFSAMISPGMFDEFVAPYISRQTSRLDNVLYHLDGPECICHLDSILAISTINAIQWTPGDGKPSLADPCWLPMFRRIRAAGKGIALYGVSPEQAEWLTRELGPQGLLFAISVSSPEDADALVEASYGWR